MFKNLDTKENRLDFSQKYEAEVITVLNNYFAKDNYTFVKNNDENKYAIDVQILKDR